MDIDFGGDDFFNSFQPATAAKEEPIMSIVPKKNGSSNRLQEVSGEPARLGQPVSSMTSSIMNFSTPQETSMSDKQANDRLRELGNRKAISSADF